ncbi:MULTISPECIES: LCP family protein [Curtobacterium]|uniref:LCP family protein n=1 Tax=Curtobacterium TaxID=2034 RepID=UPI0008DE4A69|nr:MULTISPECIES: LCP family protein [Curtobacterium]NQX22563.1 LCP family protein [Curtobacterium sp. VKM Ac-2852]MBT1606955.1 LCP family protein [Curtobacterium flaccumfaciens pv. betae]MBT1656718.1 LCP family protein [Curtobacterium flaccumfaciens pv. betae]MCE0456127.1 LCP family protein [Curtobacterium allii]MCS0472589.1 LCP family protein [Curtobacterium flaccumfaciens pv. betae]
MSNEPEQTTEPAHRGAATPRHGRQKRRAGVVFPAVAGVLTMALLLCGGYAAYAYHQLSDGVTIVNAITGGKDKKDDVDGTAQNILLVGDDHRPDNATPEQLAELSTEEDGGATNTDTMIVLHINADGSQATMISFPRDSYVDIPDVGKGKLNSAFYYGTLNGGGDTGGAKMLIKTIENLSGLQIDHYVRVSLLGFYQVVKELGPVEVCLNQAANDPFSGVNLPAGKSSLDAKEALSFVRQRHGLPNGDLDRNIRQQYFLSQEARKVTSAGTLLNPVKMGNILQAVGGSIQTDTNLIDLASQMANLRPANIQSATIPTLGTPTISVNGSPLSIVEVDTVGLPAFVQGLVGEPEAYTAAGPAQPANTSVTVLNGSGVQGAATAAGQVLTARGFQVAPAGSSPTTKVTQVQYPAGQESQAKAVAAVVPGAVAVRTNTVTGVTLVLGTDGKTAKPVATEPSAAPSTPADTGSGSKPAEQPAKEPSPKSTDVHNYGTEGTCIN